MPESPAPVRVLQQAPDAAQSPMERSPEGEQEYRTLKARGGEEQHETPTGDLAWTMPWA